MGKEDALMGKIGIIMGALALVIGFILLSSVLLFKQLHPRTGDTVQLLNKLEEGEQSAGENGWLTAGEVEAALGL